MGIKGRVNSERKGEGNGRKGGDTREEEDKERGLKKISKMRRKGGRRRRRLKHIKSFQP